MTKRPPSQLASGRRTQKERRDGTQRVLLEATIGALCDLGYVGATTLEVEQRAGVSRGARIHHFPTKAALLASAVDHLYDQLGDHYEQAFGSRVAGRSDAERFRSGLRMLWAIYSAPGYTAVLELWMAARTDAELREHLNLVSERHGVVAIEAIRKFFPVLEDERAYALIETVHTALLGMLMQRSRDISDTIFARVLSMLDELSTFHFEQAKLRREADSRKTKARSSRKARK